MPSTQVTGTYTLEAPGVPTTPVKTTTVTGTYTLAAPAPPALWVEAGIVTEAQLLWVQNGRVSDLTPDLPPIVIVSTDSDAFTGTDGATVSTDVWRVYPAATLGRFTTDTGGTAKLAGNAGRLLTGTTGGYQDRVIMVAKRPSVIADQRVAVTVTTPVTGREGYLNILARAQAGDANIAYTKAYCLEVNLSAGSYTVSVITNDAKSNLAGARPIPGWAANTPIRVSLKAVGDTITAAAWPASGTEPAQGQPGTWSGTSTAISTPGYTGFQLIGGNAAGTPVDVLLDDWSLNAPDPTPGSVTTPPTFINPFADQTLYVDPNCSAAQAMRAETDPTRKDLLKRIADYAVPRWYGQWITNPGTDVNARVTAAATAGGRLPVVVLYNIPGRDNNNYSAGGATSAAAYRSYVDSFAAGIGTAKCVVIVEPDALAQASALDATRQAERYDLINYAVDKLGALPATAVYLDAGNATWVPAAEMGARLVRAGVARTRGFSVNVSNFITTADSTAYGEAVSSATSGKSYVVDTSRNGLGPLTSGTTQEKTFNPPGRALGERPLTPFVGAAHLDALLWVKIVGESDGPFPAGAPAAGTFYPDYAIGLAQRAPWAQNITTRGVPLEGYGLPADHVFKLTTTSPALPFADGDKTIEPPTTNDDMAMDAEIVANLNQQNIDANNNGVGIGFNVYGGFTNAQYSTTNADPVIDFYTLDHRGPRVTDPVYRDLHFPDGDIGVTENNHPQTGSDFSVAMWDPITGKHFDGWKARFRSGTEAASILDVQQVITTAVNLGSFPSSFNGIPNVRGQFYLLAGQGGSPTAAHKDNGLYVYIDALRTQRVRPNGVYLRNVVTERDIDLAAFPQVLPNGETPGNNAVVLLLAQADPAQNQYVRTPGSYTAGVGTTPATILTGPDTDVDWQGVRPNSTTGYPISVRKGPNAGQVWTLTTTGTITPGTTALAFAQVPGADPNRGIWLTSKGGVIDDVRTQRDARFALSGGASGSGNANSLAMITVAEGKEIKRRAAAGLSLRGVIKHAVTFGMRGPATYRFTSWPAQRSDGSSEGAPFTRLIMYGTRFVMDGTQYNPDIDGAGLHPMARALLWTAIDYGWMANEKTALNMAFSGERGSAAPVVPSTTIADPWPDILTKPGATSATPSYAVCNGIQALIATPGLFHALHRNFGRDGNPTVRAIAPVTAAKPTALYLQSEALAATTPTDASTVGTVILNGQELGRLPALRRANADILTLAYLNMGMTKDYEYQDDYGPANPLTQPYDWVKYPTTGVPYGQALQNESWFLHKAGTAGGSGNRQSTAVYPGLWMMNVGVTAYQDQWAANAIAFCKAWGFDGVMADDCLAYLVPHVGSDAVLEYANSGAYRVAVQSFLTNVGAKMKAAGLHLTPNVSDAWRIGDTTMTQQWATACSGMMFEHFTTTYQATSYVPSDYLVTLAQYVLNVQAGGGYALAVGYHPQADTKAMRCGRAVFELVRSSATRSAYAYQGVTSTGAEENPATPIAPQWAMDLGATPTGMATVGTARTRQLSKGFVAVNPVGGAAQTITCPIAGTRVSNGAAITAGTTFTLQPDDAEIVRVP